MDSTTLVALVRELGIGTLLGTLLGWLLSQLTQSMTNRRERRKALGKTLADLLEIRHLLLAVPSALKAFSSIIAIPPEAQLFMKSVFSGWLIPNAESLSKRYDEAVTTMAETNPGLSFRLRSKQLILPWLQQLRCLALQHGDKSAARLMTDVEDMISDEYRAMVEKLILDVAWRYSVLTWWEMRKALKDKDLVLPTAIESKLRDAVVRQQEEGAPPASAQAETSNPAE
jgi:hypothetical protein